MKVSGKMYFKMILKVTKNQGYTLSLEDTFFEKPQGGGQIDPSSRFRVQASNAASINEAKKFGKHLRAEHFFKALSKKGKNV